jgi:hypothetical protein
MFYGIITSVTDEPAGTGPLKAAKARLMNVKSGRIFDTVLPQRSFGKVPEIGDGVWVAWHRPSGVGEAEHIDRAFISLAPFEGLDVQRIPKMKFEFYNRLRLGKEPEALPISDRPTAFCNNAGMMWKNFFKDPKTGVVSLAMFLPRGGAEARRLQAEKANVA